MLSLHFWTFSCPVLFLRRPYRQVLCGRDGGPRVRGGVRRRPAEVPVEGELPPAGLPQQSRRGGHGSNQPRVEAGGSSAEEMKKKKKIFFLKNGKKNSITGTGGVVKLWREMVYKFILIYTALEKE